MSIYAKKSAWKIWLLVMAVAIGIASLYHTNRLVKKLAAEERKKVELWAEATRKIVGDVTVDANFEFLLKVIQNNETVPVIVADNHDNILYHRNLDTTKLKNPKYAARSLEDMKAYAPPILIELPGNKKQYIYYNRSTLLTNLFYYPYVQLAIIFLFVLIAYLAFSASRKAEQNQVWVGLSKETAHQLGTPISSLLAWLEIAKSEFKSAEIANEFEKDIRRLEKITDRFSKIGARPKLEKQNIYAVLQQAVMYMKSRASDKVNIGIETSGSKLQIPLNAELFEWVIENLCKNAMDAIEGIGSINISAHETSTFLHIDISDNGRGIPKSKQNTIFKPGFTTKSRGWGLGLSLARRIIEEYHNGKIFVLHSEHGKGTTFRITLKRVN